MNYKEDDLVLCKVKNIEGTTVWVESEDGTKGSIILPEVAAGRIRNLRKYVSPNKLVVCKVLHVKKDHLELSLRRVTVKERDKVMESYKKERALRSMLKASGENPDKIIPRIKKEYEISDFIEEARDNPKVLEKFMNAAMAKKIGKIISEKEGKEKRVGNKFSLKSFSGSGLNDIKEILGICEKGCEIHYLGSSKFSVSVSGKNFKEANVRMEKMLDEIEKRAKKKAAVFEMGKERK